MKIASSTARKHLTDLAEVLTTFSYINPQCLTLDFV